MAEYSGSHLCIPTCTLQSQRRVAGPWMLDLGDVLYAPTVFTDAQGRLVMLAWMQELRSGQGRLYAGCLSVPRLLTLRGMPASLMSPWGMPGFVLGALPWAASSCSWQACGQPWTQHG